MWKRTARVSCARFRPLFAKRCPMSHAEVLHVRHPAAGATEAITGFVSALRYASLSEEVRHYARRHLFDTIGVMIAGASGEVASRAEAAFAGVRPAGGGRV